MKIRYWFLLLFSLVTAYWILSPDARRRFNDWVAEDAVARSAKVPEAETMRSIDLIRMSDPGHPELRAYLDSLRRAEILASQVKSAAAVNSYFKTSRPADRSLDTNSFKRIIQFSAADVVSKMAAMNNPKDKEAPLALLDEPISRNLALPKPVVEPKPPQVQTAADDGYAGRRQDVLDPRFYIFRSRKDH